MLDLQRTDPEEVLNLTKDLLEGWRSPDEFVGRFATRV